VRGVEAVIDARAGFRGDQVVLAAGAINHPAIRWRRPVIASPGRAGQTVRPGGPHLMKLQLRRRILQLATFSHFARLSPQASASRLLLGADQSQFRSAISRTLRVLQDPLFAESPPVACRWSRSWLPTQPWPSSPPARSVGGHQRVLQDLKNRITLRKQADSHFNTLANISKPTTGWFTAGSDTLQAV